MKLQLSKSKLWESIVNCLFCFTVCFLLMFTHTSCSDSVEPDTVNQSPDAPVVIFPLNGSSDISINVRLSWTCSDPDGDIMNYSVYLGKASEDSLQLIGNALSETQLQLSDLDRLSTYIWKVIASDGVNSSSNTWSFTTADSIQGFVRVEGGTFLLGTDYELNEHPIHSVTVSSFHIGKYEVTQQEYFDVMGYNPSGFLGWGRPVETVSWFDCIEFCNRKSLQEGFTPCYSYLTYGHNPSQWPDGWKSNNNNHHNVTCNWAVDGYRLPTEAEWMFAARGGNSSHGYTYSGSNIISEVAWYDNNASDQTHLCGQKLPNELGIYDMTGNVRERCWDKYIGSYPVDVIVDPTGSTFGDYRVRLGGSWWDTTADCRVAARNGSLPSTAFNSIGLRLVRR